MCEKAVFLLRKKLRSWERLNQLLQVLYDTKSSVFIFNFIVGTNVIS